MQKLVWKNSIGDEIDLTSGSYGITEWEGFANTSLNIQSQQVPFQDGGVFLDALMEQRELSVTLAMNDGGNLETRYRLRRELIHALNPKLGEGYLIYTNDFISKRIKCVAQIPLFETHNSNDSGTPKASLAWTACEPYWEDLEETEVELINGSIVNIENDGDVPVQVKINLSPIVQNAIIANRTNGKKIGLAGTFINDINIDTNTGKKKIESNDLLFAWNAGGNLYDVVFADGKYVYVGSQITVEDMFDDNIHQVLLFNTYSIFGITYGNGKFVAVGMAGTIYISSDGIQWTKQVIYERSTLYSICFINGQFYILATERGVHILISSDLENWTTIDIPNTNHITFRKIIYENNQFVIVGDSGEIGISSDGTNWNIITTYASTYFWSVCYGNGLFVAVGTDGGIYVSYNNGANWISVNSGTTEALTGISYGNGMFIAVGDNGCILSSSDGINWNVLSTLTTSVILNVKYINHTFYAIGGAGVIITSLDGIEWNVKKSGTTKSSFSNSQLFKTIKVNNKIYAGGFGGYLINSSDGTNWNQKKITTLNIYDIIYINNLLIAVTGANSGTGNSILVSFDGENWEETQNISDTGLQGITYGNGLYIVVGKDGRILSSEDLVTWTYRRQTTGTSFTSVCFGNNMFVAVGSTSASIYSSNDGITWTERLTPSNSLNCVIYANNRFIAVGAGSGIYTSIDGINWSQVSTLQETVVIHSVYYENMYVLSCSDGIIYTSVDLVNWTKRETGFIASFYSAVFAKDSYFVVGDYGIIYKSFLEKSNIISELTSDSDITFNLETQNNEIVYLNDNIEGQAVLKYRQKYIGV